MQMHKHGINTKIYKIIHSLVHTYSTFSTNCICNNTKSQPVLHTHHPNLN